MVAAAIVGGAVVSGVASNRAAKKQSEAAAAAGDTQAAQAYAAMEQQQEQFSRVMELLGPYTRAATGGFNPSAYLRSNPDVAADPYFSENPEEHFRLFGSAEGRLQDADAYLNANPDVAADPYYRLHPDEHYRQFGRQEGRSAGTRGSLTAQQDLLGLNGDAAQDAAIRGIENSPYFSGLVKQGENAILQNASATGGLRGGNTQGALAQFRPNMLAAAIQQQYANLGGITSLGQNAAAGVGNAGQSVANANSALLGQVGAAQAGGILGSAAGQVQGINGISSAFGTGLSGLSNYFNQPSYSSGITGTGGSSGVAAYGSSVPQQFF